MNIRVKLPNGKYGKFPDGTSHDVIKSTIQKQFPPTGVQPEQETSSQEPSSFQRAVSAAANNPITEAAISAGPALVNSLGNVANLIPEVAFGKKLVPKMERPYPEPTDTAGKIGSKIGDIAGSAVGMAAIPGGATTIKGGLAAGFATGEGSFLERLKDSLLGTIMPAGLHAGKFGKAFLDSRKISKNIKELGLQKAAAEKGVFGAKENLANQLNKELNPVKSEKESLAGSLENLAGNSESVSKEAIGREVNKTEKDITSKFKG